MQFAQTHTCIRDKNAYENLKCNFALHTLHRSNYLSHYNWSYRHRTRYIYAVT